MPTRLAMRAISIVAALLIAVPSHAQFYQGWFVGTVTQSEFWVGGGGWPEVPLGFDIDGEWISGDFTVDQRSGTTEIGYTLTSPPFAFSGFASDSDANPSDHAQFNSVPNSTRRVLIAWPYDQATGSSARFTIEFDVLAANNPSVPFTGPGWYEFYESYGPNGYMRGNIEFSFIYGALSATPEPAAWALLIGGFALAGAALRSRWQRPMLA